jgi:hypothetical protein
LGGVVHDPPQGMPELDALDVLGMHIPIGLHDPPGHCIPTATCGYQQVPPLQKPGR